jgi:hypothetical protein
MPMPQKYPLRPLREQEEQELRRIDKASSERVDVVRRARALLAVAAKQTFSQAASSAGFKEARSVSQLVECFNRAATGGPLHCRRSRAQSHLHEPAPGSHPSRSPAAAGSQRGSDGDLVAFDAAAGASQGGAAPHRQRNHSAGLACSWL